MGPPDPILGLTDAFNKDTHPKKISLGVGAYRDDNGKPYLLPSVVAAEAKLTGTGKEYAGISGVQEFVDLSLKFAVRCSPTVRVSKAVLTLLPVCAQYADAGGALSDKRVAAVQVPASLTGAQVHSRGLLVIAADFFSQAMSGTGACSLAGSFFKKFIPGLQTMYVPDPTWGNHHNIFRDVGLPTTAYKYYDGKSGLDYEGMLASINDAPDGQVFLLHACAHNPTGIDPTIEQW